MNEYMLVLTLLVGGLFGNLNPIIIDLVVGGNVLWICLSYSFLQF